VGFFFGGCVHAYVFVVLNWILLVGLVVLGVVWLREAWRIAVQRDFSRVALKRGEPPPDPARVAPFAAVVNLLGGTVAVATVLWVVFDQPPYEAWNALGGITIWLKLFANFILARHAHAATARSKRAG
jgi:hypothetical protein